MNRDESGVRLYGRNAKKRLASGAGDGHDPLKGGR